MRIVVTPLMRESCVKLTEEHLGDKSWRLGVPGDNGWQFAEFATKLGLGCDIACTLPSASQHVLSWAGTVAVYDHWAADHTRSAVQGTGLRQYLVNIRISSHLRWKVLTERYALRNERGQFTGQKVVSRWEHDVELRVACFSRVVGQEMVCPHRAMCWADGIGNYVWRVCHNALINLWL